jgi:spermidine synthase
MTVEEFKSKYSKRLIVKKIWDWGWHYYVTTGILTQSGGIMNDIWKPVIKNYKLKIKNCLVLGLATGTLAKIINKKFKNAKITGVEIDPVMIEVGKKYFDLDKIPNLKIVNKDAKEFSGHFDVIFVDLYIGDRPPSFLYSLKYLKKLRKAGKVIIFNHLFYDDQKKKAAQVLIKRLDKYYKKITLRHVLTNVMIICE